MFLTLTLFSGFAAACAQTARPLPLARTPPMGWNSWNHFAQTVTDADVRAAGDAMVANGMRDAGYIYVNIDDSWEGTRDADGILRSNDKFPDMKALADYVHSKGLKLGIYSSPGAKTCAKYEGSLGHEAQDAKTYAEWASTFLSTTFAVMATYCTKKVRATSLLHSRCKNRPIGRCTTRS